VASESHTNETEQRLPRSSSWALAMLTPRPPRSRAVAVAIIVALALLLGWIDYVTGVFVSLRPFYYTPIALALAWFGWRAATVTSFACVAIWLASDFLAGSPGTLGFPGLWNTAIALVTFLFVVWTLEVLLSLHREMERRIEARTASLQKALAEQEQLRRELIEIAARERNAVGRELHDGLCQHLAATALATQLLADRLTNQGLPGADNARQIVGLMQEGITQSRRLAGGLLLDALEPARLPEELRELAGAVAQQNAMTCRFNTADGVAAPDAATAAQLLRIAQEAVRNAVKHAKADSIAISLNSGERELRLEVADDGAGLPPPEQREGGMGLAIMAHRAAAIGGRLVVENLAPHGTRVSCDVPLAAVRT
jgi:signal transduction histidine kinase